MNFKKIRHAHSSHLLLYLKFSLLLKQSVSIFKQLNEEKYVSKYIKRESKLLCHKNTTV